MLHALFKNKKCSSTAGMKIFEFCDSRFHTGSTVIMSDIISSENAFVPVTVEKPSVGSPSNVIRIVK